MFKLNQKCKKNAVTHMTALTVALWQGRIPATRHKLSSFWLVLLLVDDMLIVVPMSVASFLQLLASRLSSSSSCPVLDLFDQTLTSRPVNLHSLRNVPIITTISDDSLLGDNQQIVFNFLRFLVQLQELVDLSSLKLFKSFLCGEIPLEVFHYHHTFVELCDLDF